MNRHPTLAARCFAEALGTFILVFFGCGSVHAAVLAGAQTGLWQVAIVWGIAVMLAIYVTGGISGAHINPAITLAMFAWRRFPARWVIPYLFSQLVGAALAAFVLLFLYEPYLGARERDLHIERGYPGSELTAMCYGEYFPNPAKLESLWARATTFDAPTRSAALAEYRLFVSPQTAFLAELIGTMLLALVVFAVTDERNPAAPQGKLGPVFIGLTVAVLISVIAPLTQACFNPARDFGPRLVAFFAGWYGIAWPGPAGAADTLLVYAAAPSLGAILGGALCQFVLRPTFPVEPTP